jgi:hypothetical protein
MKGNTMRAMPAILAAGLGLWLGGATMSLAAGYQMKVEFSGYTGRSETLTNFPVLVVLSNNVAGSGFDYATMLSGAGHDLRFVTNLTQTTSLNYEIETWNTNAGQASYVWVQVPALPPDGTGAIWAKWGNAADGGQLPCTTNGATWAGSFAAVWHLSESSGTRADATGNGNNGTPQGGVLATSSGFVAGANSFDGAARPNSDYVETTTMASTFQGSSPRTVSAWIYTDQTQSSAVIAKNNNASLAGKFSWTLRSNSTQKPAFQVQSADGYWIHTADNACIPSNTWVRLTAVLTSFSPKNIDLYVNGVEVPSTQVSSGTTPPTSWPTADTPVWIGKEEFNATAYPFKGLIDEVRIANGALSSDWIWAEYRNMASNAVFSVYQAVEAIVSAAPTIVNGVARNIQETSADLTGTLVEPGDTAARVYLFCATNDYANNAAAWTANGSATNFGPFAAAATFTNTVSGLTLGTTYYWTHMASNAAGVAWATAGSAPSFRTAGPPVVDNASGATSIGKTFAALNGNLVDGAPATVGIALWADGTTVTNTYNFSGSRGAGAFSTNVAGLVSGTLYHYRCFASNSYSTAWAVTVADFTAYAPGVPTSGDVTWTGAAVGADWDYDANWLGGVAPTNPTAATVTYASGGQSVVGRLEADRQVGGLYFNADCAHSLDLGGRGLTLAGNLTGADYCAWSFRVTNGTLRLGTPGAAANLTVGRLDSATLTLSPGTILDPVNVGRISLGEHTSSGSGQGLLDLRGCTPSATNAACRCPNWESASC